MYSINFIKETLKKYVDNNVNQFIIYPFGTNGVNVRNVLKDYFDLNPCFIVDNEYSKYSSKIINGEELKTVYQNDMYIILTIENKASNIEMFNELLKFVPYGNILNLKDDKNKEAVSNKGFLLTDFLPDLCHYGNGNIHNKIKVRIIHSTPSIWNCIESICCEIKKEALFDLLFIGLEGVRHVGQYEYKYVLWNDYAFQDDRPDIVILTSMFEIVPNPEECRENTKLIFAVPGYTIKYDDTLEKCWERMQKNLGVCKPDYYLIDTYLYNGFKNPVGSFDQIIEMGNAKFDGMYHAIQEKTYLKEWEKLKGKTTILWAETHGVNSNYMMMKQVSFDLYARTIFEYAYENQKVGIIFRPHPAFVQEMIHFNFWTEKDLHRLEEYCIDSPNIIFDTTETYNNAFAVSDGIITSAFCGIIYSALPTMKPICACFRSIGDVAYEPELIKNCYSAYSSEDIKEFLDMIKVGKDPLKLQRKKASERYIKHFDGKNGKRIKEFIKEKYFERYKILE